VAGKPLAGKKKIRVTVLFFPDWVSPARGFPAKGFHVGAERQTVISL
jgi:hypothetical protein